MRRPKIGHIILHGGTIEELQKEFPDFPREVTVEYFTELGYMKSTAQKYLYLLNQNAKSITSDGKNTDSLKPKQHLENIICSVHADFDNILVDTCALGFSECISIIEQAKHVTFILSTLKEMDKKQYEQLMKKKIGKCSSEQLRTLAHNIRLYTGKILENPDKYMLSTFSGYSGTNYVDDTLIEYLNILPKQIRPTLLTADKNLSAKLRAYNLDCITRMASTMVSTNVNNLTFIKKLGYGINLISNNNSLYINYEGPQKLEIHHKGTQKCLYARATMHQVKLGDCICLFLRSKDKIFITIPPYNPI